MRISRLVTLLAAAAPNQRGATREWEWSSMKRFPVFCVLVLAVLLCAAAPAFAGIGVGTDTRSIEISRPLAAGGTYALIPFSIINTGTEASGYGILPSPTSKPGRRVPPSWLSFDPAAFYLHPEQSARVAATLHIPADAAPGTYQIQLLGVPKMPDLTSGGRVNVGVGPLLSFTVVAPSIWQRAYFVFMDHMPWSAVAVFVLLVLVVAAIVLLVLRRRGRRRPADSAVQGAALAAASPSGRTI